MKHLLFVPLVLTALSCTGPGPVQAPPHSPADAELPPALAYARYCADCHEEGRNGAPRTGDREAWSGRSWLWEAVLFEHARSGYLEMPARGGEESLADATVTRAAEHMLSLAYPELRR